jgi:diguanylate cyclase (GGDEF)-like protein
MSTKLVKTLLLVEDNLGDARLLREMLNEQNSLNTQLTHLQCMSDAESHLARHAVDIILLDLGLSDAQGLDAIRRAHAAAPGVPLVVLTGLDDESLAVQALQLGAQDYLIKGQIETRGLLRALRYAIERKTMESAALSMARQMAHSAEHDFLTGLPNRMLLNDRIGRGIALAARHMKKVAVLFLDLDGFKHINDSLGHPIGDKLLQSVAQCLMGCVRGSDSVSRQGGDEFVVLLLELEHAEDAAVTARRMLEAVAQPHAIGQHELHVTASIGVSVYPDDGLDAETLIKNADTAMYQAKEDGRRSFQFFKPAMNVRAVERQFIEEGLRRALERQELALYYQPKVDLMTGAITGAEALLRWTHPTRGPIAPADFIPVAEDCGLILPIGAWVLRQACAQARAWLDEGLPSASMAVNVSAIEFRDKNFLDGLFAILHETRLDPRSLELELTESVLMKHAASTATILQALRKKGIRVAVDDFGTGYSSLSYLQRFPVDALKIDRSFISQISTAGDDTAIVKAVIGMARGLKLRVIAEGVESPEEAAFLRAYRCEEAQGYYFSRPVPPRQFAMLLKNGMPESGVVVHQSPAPATAAAN